MIICQLHSEKTRFLETSAKNSILESIFQAFWIPQNVPRINYKLILEVILGQEGSREISSSANMAPRTDLDRFSIDVSLIWGWIVQALATKLRIPDRRHRPQGLYNPPRCEGFTAAGRVGWLCNAKPPSCTSTVQLLAHFL